MRSSSEKKTKPSSWFTSSRVLVLLAAFSTIIPVFYLAWYTHVFDKVYKRLPKTSENLRKDSVPPVQLPKEFQVIDQQSLQQVPILDHHEPIHHEELVEHNDKDHVIVQESHEENHQTDSIPARLNMPGAKAHQILALSNEELENTGIDVMMSWYGESEGGGSCANDFGNSLVNRWRQTRKPYCKESDSTNLQRKSKIDCFLVHQTRHHGNGDNLCVMENVAIDLGLFGKQDVTSAVIQEYVNTRHNVQPYVKFNKGFIEGNCEIDHNLWASDNMPGWNNDFANSLVSTSQINLDTNEICKEWIDHPVLLTERDTFANFFHDSEDFVNVFLAMAILQWKPKDTQLFLTDLYPEGPFWEMWSKVYSHGHDALTAFKLKEKYGKNGDSNYVCFKSVAFGIYGPAAPITVASWDTPCFKTALVRAYSDYVIRSLNLHDRTHYAHPTPPKTLTITYMARRASKEWPERKYCNDHTSFFLCRYWDNFGPRQLGRMIANDVEVVRTLKTLEKLELPHNGKVVVNEVDYNILTFEEQIAIDIQTDIMIGPHGAGLMHNIFMPDRAGLIELFVDGSSVNRHFHNLASWSGRKYDGRGMTNPVNIQELLQAVKTMISRIDLDEY